MLAAHRKIVQSQPGTLLIIAPRNASDGDDLAELASQSFGTVMRRSQGEHPDTKTDVYIADTIGEMGLWYRLAPVSFVGHSLGAGDTYLEGKNPFEAAALGSAIIHGPSVSYFGESYEALRDAEGSREVDSVDALADAVLAAFNDAERKRLTSGAMKVIAERRTVLEDTWNELLDMLNG